jgi:hypothetical protein
LGCLPDLAQHHDFDSESSFSQDHMNRFSGALSGTDLKDFQLLVSVEAIQSDVETAEEAAISRLHPIQSDGRTEVVQLQVPASPRLVKTVAMFRLN